MSNQADSLRTKLNIKKPQYSFFIISFMPLMFLCSVQANDGNEEQLLDALLGHNYASIASGYKQQIADSPGVVTVITADDIQKMGATSMSQVLNTIPGVHVSTARGLRTIFAVRGIYSENNSEFLIKIDDVPVRDPVLSSRPVTFSMPVKNISRIEVVRGPGSVIHGSDAISGIVNVITKTGSELINDPADGSGSHATASIGSFDTFGGSLVTGGKSEDLEYSLSVQAETTNGSNRIVRRDAQTVIDNQFMTVASNAPGSINQEKTQIHMHLDLGYQDKLRIRLGVRAFEDVGTGIGASNALAPNDSISDRLINADIEYQGALGSLISTKSTLSYQTIFTDFDVHHLPKGSSLIPNGMREVADYIEHQMIAQSMAIYSGLNHHKIQAGGGTIVGFLTNINHKQDYIVQNTPLGSIPVSLPSLTNTKLVADDPLRRKSERYQVFGMIQDEWNIFPDSYLTTGIRVDGYVNEQTVFSPRASFVHHFSPLLTGKLMYNRSFHMISFLEEGLGDDLEPEIIDMVELSVETKDLQSNSFNASWFAYKLNNLIVERSGAIDGPAFENINLRGTGAELSVKRHFTNTISATLSYSFNWVVDQSGDVYGMTPNHMVFTEINWEFLPTWHINSQIKWISKRKRREAIDTRKPLNGYTNATLNISKLFHYAKFRDIRLNFKIDNLFDVDIREPSNTALLLPDDTPLPGRSFIGSIEIGF